jgi:hypothetical protein
MFGYGFTDEALSKFESRLTIVNGAHFFIAANRREAYPISAAEAVTFRDLYRRRMERARWIRRLSLILFIPLMLLIVNLAPKEPRWLQGVFATLAILVFLILPQFGVLQHPITSWLTRNSIERQLQRRMTTRLPAALKPRFSALGRFARTLLLCALAAEIGSLVLHMLGGPEEFGAHMRVFTGLTDGEEGWLAQVTGRLSWLCYAAILLAFVLLMVDRRAKRAAEKADAMARGRGIS